MPSSPSPSPNPSTPSIPSHLSESLFRVYEPHITRGVERFPEETEYGRELFRGVDGRPVSGNTFVARFRDAVASLQRFGWSPTTVDVAKLWSIAGQFSVAIDPSTGSVWFRQRVQVRRPPSFIREARANGVTPWSPGDDGTTWNAPTIFEIDALVLLIHTKRLSGPIVLAPAPSELTPEAVTTFEANYNVAFTPLDNGKYVVT